MRDDDLQVLGSHQKMMAHKKIAHVLTWIVLPITTVLAGVLLYGLFFEKHEEDKEVGKTTIVAELQQVVDSILNNEMEIVGAMQGQAIVMDVKTGRILAMAGREQRYDGKFQPCENFAYQQEPGATMMTVALLALLETELVELTDEVDAEEGIWNVDDWQMHDHNWHRGGYGKMTLERALEVSSNIGISKMINKIFKGRELSYFKLLDKMSFGQPEHVKGIDGLKPMVFSSPKDSTWASRQLLWNSIGYERMMAPIQMLTFYNAIANNGKMVKPTLQADKIEVINPQIASNENIESMQMALEHVVSQGLGKKAGTPLLSVAGKTGTSIVGKFDYGEEIYVDEYQLSFCGYFPADAPKYSIIVSMNKLGLPASGGGMCGPVFHDIVEWMLTHGMPNTLMADDETGDTIKITPDNVDSIVNISAVRN